MTQRQIREAQRYRTKTGDEPAKLGMACAARRIRRRHRTPSSAPRRPRPIVRAPSSALGAAPEPQRRILEEALRIDVELHLHRAANLRPGGDHRPQEGLDVGALVAMDEQPEAVAATHDGERRLGRPEHGDA